MDNKEKAFQERLLGIFRTEAAEHVQALSSGLVGLEHAAAAEESAAITETIFREAHSLKGAARAVGLSRIESICHAVENVLAALKRKDMALSPALFDVLHGAVDFLGTLLASNDAGSAPQRAMADRDVVGRLEAILEHGTAATAAAEPLAPSIEPAEHTPRGDPARERSVLPSTVRIATDKLDVLLLRAEELLSVKLAAFQRVAEIREAVAELAALVKEQVRVSPVQPIFQRTRQYDVAGAGAHGSGRPDPQLGKLLETMAGDAAALKSLQSKLAALASSAEYDRRSLSAMVDGLLDDMKRVLMLPIASALEVFPKMVRDLSHAQGKDVELATAGGEIEIDRRVLEEVRDPLIHLVRNCIDHGIETVEMRQRAGKPPQGTITLAMTQKHGNKIEILVSDDGAGIELSKIQEAARKLGLISPEDADSTEILPLVFQSGVSTAPIITDLSGRGLGLAIVQEKVEWLGGIVSVETEPGRGTAFRIVLPLTLSTFRGVQVRVNEQHFVLPTTHVEQGLRVRKELIQTVENRETIPWNGRAVALVRLADVLEMSPARGDGVLGLPGASAEHMQVLILGSTSQRIAFVVDEIVSEQEVLVKPLGTQLARVRNVAGATVLGTGMAVPILHVADLLRSAVKITTKPAARGEIPATAVPRKSILVAEDSITSRALLQNILESAGYRVATAVDGMDGLTRLKTEPFDLLVSDVEMPRMNGFDLTTRIRADKALAQLPVILVTSLESREHRELGVDAGANAYIVKSSFDQSNLLETVRKLI